MSTIYFFFCVHGPKLSCSLECVIEWAVMFVTVLVLISLGSQTPFSGLIQVYLHFCSPPNTDMNDAVFKVHILFCVCVFTHKKG